MRLKITCPESAHLEEIEFSEDPVDGKIIGVSRCSGLDPADIVDCEMVCIKRLNARAACGDRQAEARDDSSADEERSAPRGCPGCPGSPSSPSSEIG